MDERERAAVLARFRAKLHEPPLEPLEATREFLMSYVMDAGDMNEIEASIAYMANVNTKTLREGLAGMEGVLANPPDEPNVLRNLMALEVGLMLADDSDEGVKAFLRELAEVVRRHLTPRTTGESSRKP